MPPSALSSTGPTPEEVYWRHDTDHLPSSRRGRSCPRITWHAAPVRTWRSMSHPLAPHGQPAAHAPLPLPLRRRLISPDASLLPGCVAFQLGVARRHGIPGHLAQYCPPLVSTACFTAIPAGLLRAIHATRAVACALVSSLATLLSFRQTKPPQVGRLVRM